jgi:hypothetical protein
MDKDQFVKDMLSVAKYLTAQRNVNYDEALWKLPPHERDREIRKRMQECTKLLPEDFRERTPEICTRCEVCDEDVVGFNTCEICQIKTCYYCHIHSVISACNCKQK